MSKEEKEKEKEKGKKKMKKQRFMVYLRGTRSVVALLEREKIVKKTNVNRVQDAIARYTALMGATKAPVMNDEEKEVLYTIFTSLVGEVTAVKLHLLPALVRESGVPGAAEFAERMATWSPVETIRAVEAVENMEESAEGVD